MKDETMSDTDTLEEHEIEQLNKEAEEEQFPEALNRSMPDMELMPATLYYPNHGGFGCYVRWKGNGSRNVTRVISASSWNLHMELPDREVYVVGDLNGMYPEMSFGEWDEFIPWSIFHENSAKSKGCGPTHFMVNAHQNMGSEGRSHATRNQFSKPGNRTIFGDSGGYQLKRKSVFIDAQTVSKYYNDNVDYGVVLDFPLLDSYCWENLEQTAEIQRMNIEIHKQDIDRRVNLINVAHGIRPEHRLRFLELVHDDRIRSVAISKSVYGDGIISFIHGLKVFIDGIQERYGEHYNHLHILGLSENRIFFPLQRMAALGLLGNLKITMDSSSHIQMATSKVYFQHRHSMENYKALAVGNDGNIPNPMQKLPCQCPVCRSLGYMDGFNVLSGNSSVVFPLMYHNIFAMDAYFQNMLWFATKLPHKQILQMCKAIFSTNKSVQTEVTQAMEFIELMYREGFEKACSKFSFFLNYDENKGVTGGIGLGSLFGSHTMLNNDELDELGFNEQDADGNLDKDKPLEVLDQERIDLYKSRLGSLMQKRQRDRDGDHVDHRPRKSRRNVRVATINADGEEEIKLVSQKRKRKKFEVKDDVKKIINNTTARTGPSLKKQKQKARNEINKKKNEGKATKVLGKTVIKSKNAKRL